MAYLAGDLAGDRALADPRRFTRRGTYRAPGAENEKKDVLPTERATWAAHLAGDLAGTESTSHFNVERCIGLRRPES